MGDEANEHPQVTAEAADLAEQLRQMAVRLSQLAGAEAADALLQEIIRGLRTQRPRGRPRGKTARRWDLCAVILEAETQARADHHRAARMSEIIALARVRKLPYANELDTIKKAIQEERRAMRHGPRHPTNPMAGFYVLPYASDDGRHEAEARKEAYRTKKRIKASAARRRAKGEE
ncbi:MAG TPA: hypothetical protein VNZ61_02410 [Roseomonas sp.]|nr:hypothetical protein [Roseomonas sp.]